MATRDAQAQKIEALATETAQRLAAIEAQLAEILALLKPADDKAEASPKAAKK